MQMQMEVLPTWCIGSDSFQYLKGYGRQGRKRLKRGPIAQALRTEMETCQRSEGGPRLRLGSEDAAGGVGRKAV